MSYVSEILESRDVTAFGKYLALLIEEEYAYEIIDQIGKAKNVEEFIDGIWKAMRLAKKLESKCAEYSKIIPSNGNIKQVLAFVERDQKALKFLSRYLGSLAFTTWSEIERAKSECEKGSGGEK
ncbi:conserved hypothetical protein [Ferroglobus placidus DSM 10642]|uniref:Uncharacterized protein n=1 Tax=Ferroglobus placidus (strain DSM 10642 / AEDII12DO) TaxID=589924 RepID=D3RZU5_FERPA|nr:hypothetical protein [Ferroglobus placidus]ADC66008.1 conserved hypothetical protein [Ferroglobus placidus DSM 10642]